jgi:hypothetical protein
MNYKDTMGFTAKRPLHLTNGVIGQFLTGDAIEAPIIISNPDSVGCWLLGHPEGGLRIFLKEKPNFIRRFFMSMLMSITWEDHSNKHFITKNRTTSTGPR